MSDTADLMLQARFDAVANTSDDSDWNDVLTRALGAEVMPKRSVRRAGLLRRVPARVALVAAVVLLAAIVTTVAFGWPRTVINFFTSPPAPVQVKNWFSAQNAEAPPGMNPQAIASQTRKIATIRFNIYSDHRAVHTLYVAPRKGGGICYLWTNADGGCLPAKAPSKTAESRAAGPLGLSWASTGEAYPLFVDGWVRAGATRTVEARFADGKTATIPVTWVSAPVNAGFFTYPLPQAYRMRGDALRSVVALDASRNVLGRESAPQPSMGLHPFGGIRRPPGGAALRKKKELVVQATPVGLASIWGAPDRVSPAHCFWLQIGRAVYGGSCGRDQPPHRGLYEVVPLVLQIKGRTLPILWGHIAGNVARLSIIFQDGDHTNLSHRDGAFLYAAPSSRWSKGHRPAILVARDNHGQVVRKRLLPEYTLAP